MRINKQLFGLLGASALLLTTACSNDNLSQPTPEEVIAGEVYGNGNSIVTLSLNPAASLGTRAGELHISDGTKAKKMFFQVYEVTEDSGVKSYTTFVPMEEVNVTSYPYTIRLAVDENANYQIAVWAQNAITDAFTVTNLENITVDYSQVETNDDLADAFCATETFSGSQEKLDVIMHRPFAQLNVGTTGADYNEFVEGNIRPHKIIIYSKMEVEGVCNKIDVLKDEISKTTNYDGKAIFKYGAIPALYGQAFTTAPSYTEAFSEENGSRDEEFLVVRLNDDSSEVQSTWNTADTDELDQLDDPDSNGFLGYRTKYPTMNEDGDYLTEKFRYMAMCYVLVKDGGLTGWPGSSDEEHDTYGSSSIDKVMVYFATGNPDWGLEDKETKDIPYANGYKYLTVQNVPAHRNWRTNLLGGLHFNDPEDNPNDTPDDPDDPSSLFANMKIFVNVCPIFFDEYNGSYDWTKDNTNNNKWLPAGYNDGQGGFPSGTEDDTLHKEAHDTESGE